ncbi:putative E3 ubiquitin-protein ligase HERC1 [Symbiodinium microadriaticum]|uniref:Putative E3 ubiquitin-protein ligase HERC1 n=1 Tax=Symbiodinium microadriaticum TaxID=2951 RepID=A0A1Q9E9L6_SYMMI|nr:putative E3 ubiquitin-protein ligase HERC1 [Symbiodinium microadriaticum]
MEIIRRLGAMAESAPVTVVISLLSGTKVAEFVVPRSDTVLDVKTRLRDVEGTPIRKQQLVLNCDILRDETRISEVTEADALEFRLVRKEGFQFHWQVPHRKGASISSPEWSLETGEAISTKACTLGLRFYPSGFESKMHREGNFSIHVKRPKSSILLARVDVAGIKRERLFTSGHGTEEGWINFAPHSHLPTTDTLDICLEVGTLKRRAQAALGIARGRLVDSSGSFLDESARLEDASMQNGDSLTLHVSQVQACGTKAAFAAILGDGSVVTWGDPFFGGDSSAVQDQLMTVRQIQASSGAFAAILGDGSVLTWGRRRCGGDSSAVQDQLKNVQQIQASSGAFAATLGDGSVVTWGDAERGGDSSAVQDQLKTVQQIQATELAFAAILGDGSVVTWGDARFGGDSRAVQDQLKTVQQVQATGYAFGAILSNGSVLTWGNARLGGDSSAVQNQLKNVQQVQATDVAFAAILADGSVVTWGLARCGGDGSAVQHQLKNVKQIQASNGAFAATLGDGSVVTWGDAERGGDSSAVQDQLKTVQQVQATESSFAAILDDGSVVTWGDPVFGGDSSAVQDQLKNAQQIQASSGAFAAILGDGSVLAWGDARCGGDSRAVQDQLKKVQQIQATDVAFAATLGDGSVVTWGDDEGGGDSIAVQVLHCAVVSKPTSEGSHITWDLRETLGRMPYAMGVPFVEEVRATSDEGTAIHLMVTFFPGGHTSAPKDHVSLWVSPLRGLEDRRYACIVDGSQEQRGSGESILHFPRVEVFGEIGIVICRSPSPDAPRRLRRFSDREYPGREPEAA